jgi:hypothetical protein
MLSLSEPAFRSFATRANKLLPGLYAWTATVASPAAAPEAGTAARAASVCALIALVLGPWLSSERPALGRALGIHVFIGMSLATWGLSVREGVTLAPEPLRAAFGALGWMVYTFGWGELGRPLRVPEDDPAVLGGPALAPRAELPRRATLVFAVGVAGALSVLALAWRVSHVPETVMAHAVALAAALWLLSATTEVALVQAPRPKGSTSERLSRASGTLSLLLIALGLGLLWFMFGR